MAGFFYLPHPLFHLIRLRHLLLKEKDLKLHAFPQKGSGLFFYGEE